MKLTTQTQALASALAVAAKPIRHGSPYPALTCALLETTPDGGLTLTGTDDRTRAWQTVGGDVTESGRVLLPARMLADWLAQAPGGDVSLTVGDNRRARLRCGRAEITLSGPDPDEFPPAVDFDAPAAEVSLPAAAFAGAVGRVAHAVAPDESRPVLAGIHLTVSGGVMTLAAADGYQLATSQVCDLDESADLSAIVPGKPLAAVASAVAKAGDVRLAVDARKRALLVESSLGCRSLTLIEGQFPDFNRVIPRQTDFGLTVDRAELLAAVRLVAPVARDNDQITRLRAMDGTLTVSATGGNQEAETVVDVGIERGAAMAWALNNTYLRNALEVLGDERITVDVAGPASPTVIYGADRQAAQMVVMAMHDARAAR